MSDMTGSPRARPAALTVSLPDLLENGSDQRFRELVFRMVLALDRLQTCRDAFGQAMNLTGSQFAVLVGASHIQGDRGVSVRDLAEHVQMAATHVTTEVGRLLRLGLLLKRPNPEDGRGVLVSLSAAGDAAVAAIVPFMCNVNDSLFAGFSRKDMAALERMMLRFSENGARTLDMLRTRAVSSAATAAPSRKRRPNQPPPEP
jgi:DNA-binding MarR family transcriptional regulator